MVYKRSIEREVSIVYDSVTRKEYLAGVRTCERCGSEGKRLFRYSKTETFCVDCIIAAIKAREKGGRYSIKKEGNKK